MKFKKKTTSLQSKNRKKNKQNFRKKKKNGDFSLFLLQILVLAPSLFLLFTHFIFIIPDFCLISFHISIKKINQSINNFKWKKGWCFYRRRRTKTDKKRISWWFKVFFFLDFLLLLFDFYLLFSLVWILMTYYNNKINNKITKIAIQLLHFSI